jgi:hypothetical protein
MLWLLTGHSDQKVGMVDWIRATWRTCISENPFQCTKVRYRQTRRLTQADNFNESLHFTCSTNYVILRAWKGLFVVVSPPV